MREGISTLLVATIALASFFNQAQAAAMSGNAGDCGALRDAITEHVYTGGTLGRDGITMFVRPWQHFVCDEPVKAVTAGFSAAMAQMNIYVAWRSPEDQRGDRCLSVHLSECYPQRHAMVPRQAADSIVVRDAWYSVQRAVDAVTGAQAGAGAVTIRARELRQAIRSEMSRNLRSGRQQAYYLQ